jgi:ferric-dicitrate binding protein FerR (iron transport regulator)
MDNRGRGAVLLGLWAAAALSALGVQPEAKSEALAYLAGTGSVWVDGQRMPDELVVFSGDVITTGSASTAVLSFKSGGAATLAENTETVLSRDAAPGTLTLRRGRVEVRTVGGRPARVKLMDDDIIVQGQDGSPALCTIASIEAALTVLPLLGHAEIHGAGPPLRVSPGEFAQLAAGPPQSANSRAGEVTRAIPEVVVRRTTGSEVSLGPGDAVNWQDLVGTLKTGKVEIQLDDTSVLTLGRLSSLQLRQRDPQTRQTQVDFPEGYLRARVAELPQAAANLLVDTLTATIRGRGTSFLVEAQRDRTKVYCTEGTVAVRNVDSAVAGEVTLRDGEFTTVVRGRPPSAVLQFSIGALVKTMDATDVNTLAQGWHIGYLSHGASVDTVVALTGGTTAAILIPTLTGGGPVSPSKP